MISRAVFGAKDDEQHADPVLGHLRAVLKTVDWARVDDIFSRSKQVTVSRNRSGHIIILVGNVSEEVLKTKISVITFTPSERYNAREAIVPIIRAKEVQTKLSKLGLEEPMIAISGRVLEPDSRLPHLEASMRNVTMEDALDQVAQKFGGIIIYGQWSAEGARMFLVGFARLTDFDTR
jgi:hypothetical protein